MSRSRTAIATVLLLVPATAVIAWLYRDAHPFGGLRIPLAPESIVRRARAVAHDERLSLAGYRPVVKLVRSGDLLRHLQRSLGIAGANEKTRGDFPGYQWSVTWLRTDDSARMDLRSGRNADAMAEVERRLRGAASFRFDPDGALLEYAVDVGDSARLGSLPIDSARTVAWRFLAAHTRVPNASGTGGERDRRGSELFATAIGTLEMGVPRPRRSEFEFLSRYISRPLGDTVAVSVTVAGDRVTRYSVAYIVPESARAGAQDNIRGLIVVALIVVFGIAMLVAGIRRLRAYEMGFGTSILLGVTVAVLFGVELYRSVAGEAWTELLISLLIAPIFVGAGMLIVWAIAEAVGREARREQFVAFDLLARGHLLHSRVGRAVLVGVPIGAAALALWLGIVRYAGTVTPLWILDKDGDGMGSLRAFESAFPLLPLAAHHFYAQLFATGVFGVFAVSFLRGKIRRAPLVVACASLPFALVNATDVRPLGTGLLVNLACAALFAWVFYREDVLTGLLALCTFALAGDATALFTDGAPGHAFAAYAFVGCAALALVVAGVAMATRDRVTDFDAIAPAFVRHVTERQRLQRELEIARDVQRSFLPKRDPVVAGLDIASRCTPALEVGGDYYDFLVLAPRRLAVAIGDVSGKGTQAAFYMTLTKGFLRAVASADGESPARVLTELNALFCDNVDRGHFVSMIYAVFDLERACVRIARAGHNPVLRRTAGDGIEAIQTAGFALGIEAGPRFEETVEEAELPLHPGDMFVFYTDGCSEAMSKTREEYGDTRLAAVIRAAPATGAAETLEEIFGDIRRFAGKTPQHDDMTMVVLRVTDATADAMPSGPEPAEDAQDSRA